MGKTMSARVAQSLQTRGALITACRNLLSKLPIDAITINNIVETAGVAKGSFYNHFPDKETLAAEVSLEIRQEIELKVRKNNENITDPAYKIARGICNHLQFTVSDPERAIVLLRGNESLLAADHEMNRTLKQHVQEAVQSGRFKAQCDDAGITLIIGAVYATCSRILQQNFAAKESIKLCTDVFTLLFCGFGVDEGDAARIVSESANDIIKG